MCSLLCRPWSSDRYWRTRPKARPRPDLGPDECQEVGVDPVLVGRAQAVRRALVDLETCVLDQLGGTQGGGPDRDDLIVIAVDDEGRHVELPEIPGEVGLGEGLDAVEGGVEARLHALEPERV